MRSLRHYTVAGGFFFISALALYTGAVSTIPAPRRAQAVVFTDGNASFAHCIRLGGRVYRDNLCLLGGR